MRFLTLLLLLFAWIAGPGLSAGGVANHVVVCVFDGMRPDFITRDLAPTLHALAARGVFFTNHHSVYLSTTHVNGTAIATGAYPARSRLIANTEFREEVSASNAFGTADLGAIRKADRVTGGQYLNVKTVAEILQAEGRRTAIAGSKPVALLHDRADRTNRAGGATVFEGGALPSALRRDLTNSLGAFPEVTTNKSRRDLWTTRALTEHLWKDGVPAFSLLWLAEPDYSQHATSPGSDTSLAGIRSSDQNLARVIQTLKDKGVLDQTDILVVSDHGFSTVGESVDIVAALRRHGFRAGREFRKPARPGDILVVGGSSVLFYVAEHDPETIERLVRFLQGSEFAGVLFSRTPFEGTFSLADARIDSPAAPDVVLSLRWSADTNPRGVPGTGSLEGDTPVGLARALAMAAGQSFGTHGCLSPFETRNTLVAAGPDFKKGLVNTLPSGNVDLAPTILWILGVRPPVPMDGRVLSEALVGDPPPQGTPRTTRIEASRQLDGQVWHQYLQRSELDGVTYLDEGNGTIRK